MKLTWDEKKRARTIDERRLDFADAELVFAGPTIEFEDTRKDYGETRTICIGFLRERMVVLVYAQRVKVSHIISMRKANDREQKKYRTRLGRP